LNDCFGKAENVNILIALGHSGYEKDLEMAEKIEDLDLVVGGHSHTFLYTGLSFESTDQMRQDVNRIFFS